MYVNWDRIFSTCSEDKTLILNAQENCFFTTEGVGQDLWKLLSQGKNLEALVKWLTEHYEVSEEVAKRDIEDFLNQLKSEGLIEIEG